MNPAGALPPPAETDPYPVTDGFLLASRLRCNFTYRSLAIENFDRLRRSGAYRSKIWPVPRDSNILIPARDSFEYQVFVGAGAAIWGYALSGITGEQPDGTISWQVTDACTDEPIWNEVVTKLFNLNGTDPYSSPVQQSLFSRIYVVGGQGLLNVQITNTFSTDQRAQLLLFGGQPVNV